MQYTVYIGGRQLAQATLEQAMVTCEVLLVIGF